MIIDTVTALLGECRAGRVAALIIVSVAEDGTVNSTIDDGSTGDMFVMLGALAVTQSQIIDALKEQLPLPTKEETQ